MPRLKSSSRAPGLKDSDYDHVIDLVDHDGPPTSPRPVSADGVTNDGQESAGSSKGHARPSLSASASKGKGVQEANGSTASAGPADAPSDSGQVSSKLAPSIDIQEATPGPVPEPTTRDSLSKFSTSERGSVIDVLYENERGCILCGIPLFSARALGNLDPTPWTNAYHKASPTNIYTAQVPDPSWEWAWPEWVLHKPDGVDEGGWEYSFMFSRKFSWHGPRWWNSFVRRRAWIRKRVKVRTNVGSSTNSVSRIPSGDYFSIVPASETRSRPGTSRAGSGVSLGSQPSAGTDAGFDISKQRIEDVETLLYVLRRARIDREKVEAVGIYLQQGTDLANLRSRMHDIMQRFIFQASRKMLLANLTRALDETLETLEKGMNTELEERKAHLEGAVKCADEEVRRLAYWSDVKGMVEAGESANAVRKGEGWGGEWEGVDQSGPAAPRRQDEGRSRL